MSLIDKFSTVEIKADNRISEVCRPVHEKEGCMSMTKKQLAALQRIINRDFGRLSGAHPSCDHYVVTDGSVAVIFCGKPDGVPEAERIDWLYETIQKDIECHGRYHDHFLALTVTADHISKWKKQVKPWKEGKTYKYDVVPVRLTAQINNGGVVKGLYKPRYLLDAVEVIGPGAMLYVGGHNGVSSLLVLPKNWMENDCHVVGYVLPVRIM